jgi:AcrR family transcriptional regulator
MVGMAVKTRKRQRSSAVALRQANRRQELLDAADRVVRRRGPAVSMGDIAAEAGITKPILYRHFGDKDGLYGALAERYVDALTSELDRAATKTGRERLAARIDAYLAFIEREPDVYRFLLGAAQEPKTSALVAEFRRSLAADCALATEQGLRRLGLAPELAEPWAHGVTGMVRAVGIWWLDNPAVSRSWLAEHLTTLLWEGFEGLRDRTRGESA